MPSLDAANIAFNILKVSSGKGVTVGPILLGGGEVGAHPEPQRDGAADRQHDGAGGGGCEGRLSRRRCTEQKASLNAAW
jgi:hypothetical protein